MQYYWWSCENCKYMFSCCQWMPHKSYWRQILPQVSSTVLLNLLPLFGLPKRNWWTIIQKPLSLNACNAENQNRWWFADDQPIKLLGIGTDPKHFLISIPRADKQMFFFGPWQRLEVLVLPAIRKLFLATTPNRWCFPGYLFGGTRAWKQHLERLQNAHPSSDMDLTYR